MTNDDYRIEKSRASVTVVMATGPSYTGDLFVQPYATRRSGPEQPIDVLNAEDAFVPLDCTGGMRLIATDLISHVLVADHLDTDASVTPPVSVELGLASGQTLVGLMLLEVSRARPRLLDFLNQTRKQFLCMRTDVGCCLVNRAQIVCARQLD